MKENLAPEIAAFANESVFGATSDLGEAMRDAMLTAAAVSFGFFGTLFHRSVDTVDEVFAILGRRFDLPEFPSLRRAAQAEAMERMRRAGRREISLAGIYDCLALDPALAGALRAAELALELDILWPDPAAHAAFHHALELGRPVLITADTYLGRAFVREALVRHGLDPVPLFISSDCNATARDSGELYDLAADYLAMPRDRLLHIGDDPQSDVFQAGAKGFATFHYRRALPQPRPAMAGVTPAAGALAARELGYQVGGPATVGFLNWLERRAKADGIDHVLFLAREGHGMDRVVRENPGAWDLPPCSYLQGSRTVFALATMTDQTFQGYLHFLIAESDGLAPYEVLERIGVPAPTPEVMAAYGLGDDIELSPTYHARLLNFLFEYRFEILKICRRNRRGLIAQLRQLGVQRGSRVALVDLGWDGANQEALEGSLRGLFDLDIQGYSLCLTDGAESRRRAQVQRMEALFSIGKVAPSVIEGLHEGRALVELLFSAPQGAVIGLALASPKVEVVEDTRWDGHGEQAAVASALADGVAAFARDYAAEVAAGAPTLPVLETAWPLVNLCTGPALALADELGSLTNLTSWAGTRRQTRTLREILPRRVAGP
ncbi:haloacid dehalogenase [Azospirillum sp. B4]|uniref:haloacid dehalogenase n=1 Tax=Azospirillum sp. B4 TaxID=95605 RepID=UPI00034C1BF5|nr:haloacid dehalogenase [Azospirillum sp. B4]